MSIESKDTLKGEFANFEFPDEDDFGSLIDSCHNQDQGIEVEVATTHQIVIPEKIQLYDLTIWSGSTQNISVGDTEGSGEYEDGTEIEANVPFIVDQKFFSISGTKSIWISGSNLTIKYYLK